LRLANGIAPGAAFAVPPPLGSVLPIEARRPSDSVPLASPHVTPGRDRPSPQPLPQPRPQPTQVVGKADALLGPVGRGVNLIDDYYNKCGLETVGPGQMAVAGIGRYATLEALIDSLLAASSQQQIVVNHGNPDEGLLMPISREVSFNNTGIVMFSLSSLADQAEQGPIDPKDLKINVPVGQGGKSFTFPPAVAVRLADKLVKLRKKRLILHFRACNMTNASMVRDYKSAFGAQMISFHGCRLLFVRFSPGQTKPGRHASEVANFPNTAKQRIRVFNDPLGLLAPMLLDIVDIDGHTQIKDLSLMEQRTPDQIHGWAEFLVRQWQDDAPDSFVVPIMWENNERTFHCPLEIGWRQKLQFV
jgi:hypothetical protein